MTWKRTPITEIDKLKTIRISPSSINTFRSCPKKWFYEYILALDTIQTIALSRGSAVHEVLEEMFKQKFVPSGEAFRPHMLNKAQKLLDKKWKEHVTSIKLNSTKDEIDSNYEESKLMIKNFFNRFCDNIQNGIKFGKFDNETKGYYYTRPIFKELWIDDEFEINFNEKWKKISSDEKIPIEDTLHVGGFIDSVQKDFENNKYLIDYKTSNKYKESLSAEYILQLSIYAYLWWKQTGSLPEFVGIKYLKYDETAYIKVNMDIIREAVNKIKHMRNDIIDFGLDEKKYFKKESKLCDWCSFKNKCMNNKEEQNEN